jgi:hypothetical protein
MSLAKSLPQCSQTARLIKNYSRMTSQSLGRRADERTCTPSRWGAATRRWPSVAHQPDPTRYHGFAQDSSIALSGRDHAMSPVRMMGVASALLAWR